MKTTIDIAKPILLEAKRLAKRRGITLRAVVEAALREAIANEEPGRRPFRLRRCAVDGKGLQPGLDRDDWAAIRSLAYEGRGG